MTMLLVIFILMMFFNVRFAGIFLFFVTFIYLLTNYSLIGVSSMKGDFMGILGSDFISFYMILLLLWAISVVLIMFYSKMLFGFCLAMLFSMLLMFTSLDFLFLFIWFEVSMIPMFMLIMYMGSYKERQVASTYMLVYTMLGSMPMLLVILNLGSVSGSYSMSYNNYIELDVDFFVQGAIMMLFLIKVPAFIVHVWLPKAHVEAPVFGSMILASVMLKMGGYGIIRCMEFMEIDLNISDLFYCLCLTGMLLVSYSCMFQIDLKVLVAYSSIVHMAFMLAGLFSGSEEGYLGAILMMLSHGISSSGMFYLVNEFYKITGSRLLILNSGSMSYVPTLCWMWLLMLMGNLGVPPCFSILAELITLVGILKYSFCVSIAFFFIIFFISCFVINMFSYMLSGFFFVRFVGVQVSTYFGAFLHLLPLNGFIFFINSCF